jgi:dihydrofolate synthase/folylpolyglutamate synthase
VNRGPDAVLERLHRLHPKVIDLSLGRVRTLLGRLGNPQSALPPVIHVAGTNGKGSVLAYLRAMFEEAGLVCHVYISPHLVRFNERISVAGRPIGDDALIALLEECESVNGEDPITFFEITTAAAMLAFARAPADVTLLETGLGGRLDATNVIARPALTALTPISIDHQGYLGESLRAIAGEKAGILKRGVACVVAAQAVAASRVIARRARTRGASLFRAPADWRVRATRGGIVYRSRSRRLALPAPALAGPHQVANAGLAIACAEILPGITVPDRAIGQGLIRAVWPGRLQMLVAGPLARILPRDWELWLDGGHNAAAGAALALQARAWCEKPLHLIVGMMETKDAEGFLRPIAPHLERLRTVAIPGHETCRDPAALAETGRRLGLDAQACASVGAALRSVVGQGSQPARVLITGSLYLAGEVLAENG